MSMTLQVLYPTDDGTTFDYDYYLKKHMKMVAETMGKHIDRTVIAKGVSGGPDTPAGFHTVATLIFADQGALDAALAASGDALADIPNFYSGTPKMLIGEVVG